MSLRDTSPYRTNTPPKLGSPPSPKPLPASFVLVWALFVVQAAHLLWSLPEVGSLIWLGFLGLALGIVALAAQRAGGRP